MLRVNRHNGEGSWMVTKFVTEHNHAMKRRIGVTRNYQLHNQIVEGTRGIITNMVDSGIKSTNMYGLFAVLHGGPSMVPFDFSMRKNVLCDISSTLLCAMVIPLIMFYLCMLIYTPY